MLLAPGVGGVSVGWALLQLFADTPLGSVALLAGQAAAPLISGTPRYLQLRCARGAPPHTAVRRLSAFCSDAFVTRPAATDAAAAGQCAATACRHPQSCTAARFSTRCVDRLHAACQQHTRLVQCAGACASCHSSPLLPLPLLPPHAQVDELPELCQPLALLAPPDFLLCASDVLPGLRRLDGTRQQPSRALKGVVSSLASPSLAPAVAVSLAQLQLAVPQRLHNLLSVLPLRGVL